MSIGGPRVTTFLLALVAPRAPGRDAGARGGAEKVHGKASFGEGMRGSGSSFLGAGGVRVYDFGSRVMGLGSGGLIRGLQAGGMS